VQVLFGTGRARLEESSDDEVEDTKTISDTASLMGKLGFGKNSMLTKGVCEREWWCLLACSG
jgi:hypothetical protein